MPTKSGYEIINSLITSGTPETTTSAIPVGNNISIGVDAQIINGANAPTTPLILEIQWRRSALLPFEGIQFTGSLSANVTIPIKNFKIPFDSESWRIKYVGADTQHVTLKVYYGTYAP